MKCKVCGKEFVNKNHNPHRKYCSKKCVFKGSYETIKKKKEINRQLGVCVNCGAKREDLKYVNCEGCRLKSRTYNQKYARKGVQIMTWQCRECNDVLVSRSDEIHQMDWCHCNKCAVDLEEHYCRIVGDINLLSKKIQRKNV